jgi:inorganic triphosphatase YgiF
MRPTHVEMEMKLIAPDPGALRLLPAALRALCDRLRDAGVVAILDIYYDTPRQRLRAAGYACRLRREGTKTRLCLKSLKRPQRGVSIREEFEQPQPTTLRRPRLTGRLGARIAALAAESPLREMFRIRNRRRVYHARANGLTLMVCADRFSVAAKSRRRHFAEVELELVAGTARDLRRFGRLLMQHLPLRSDTRSKYREGLKLARLSNF